MTRGLVLGAAVVLAALAADAAWSAVVYRCGNQYRDRPCAGAARPAVMSIDRDLPDEARVSEATQVAERESALAQRLAAERERAWSRPARPAAGIVREHRREVRSVLHAERKGRKGRDKTGQKPARDDVDFVAVDPAKPSRRAQGR